MYAGWGQVVHSGGLRSRDPFYSCGAYGHLMRWAAVRLQASEQQAWWAQVTDLGAGADWKMAPIDAGRISLSKKKALSH